MSGPGGAAGETPRVARCLALGAGDDAGCVRGVELDVVRALEGVLTPLGDGTATLRRLYDARVLGDGVMLGVGEAAASVPAPAARGVVEVPVPALPWALRSEDAMRHHVGVWRHWERRYAEHPGVFAGGPHPAVEAWADGVASCRVLCVADGEGRNGRCLAMRGHDVVAVELVAAASEAAAVRDVAPVQRVSGDVVRWLDAHPGELFDAVVAVHAHLGAGDDDLLAAQLMPRLTADARLLVVATTAVDSADDLRTRWSGLRLEVEEADGVLVASGRR